MSSARSMGLQHRIGQCLGMWLWCMALLCAPSAVWAQAQASAPPSPAELSCQPVLVGTWAAQEQQLLERPASGWEAIQLPDSWRQRWPDWNGTTWYRMDWLLPCPQQHWALSVSGIRMAGSIFWGDELLWSDRNLTPPYSRSANIPRWWPLSTQGRTGVQSVWIRVVGMGYLTPGVGHVTVDHARSIEDRHAYSTFRQRTGYLITAAMSAAIGFVAFFVWLWRRTEHTYLWFGCMQLMWTGYLVFLLRTEPLAGMSSTMQSSFAVLCFLSYAQSFWMFSLRFMGLRFRKIEAAAWAAALAWVLAMALGQQVQSESAVLWLFRWGSLLVHASCLVVIVQALRTRKVPHLWLALCWLGVLVVASHDIVVAMRVWDYNQTWSAIFGPVSTLFMAGLLGWQLAVHMRRVDRFNHELQQRVDEARSELAQVLAQQHAQELEHAKLQERVHLAHDLHDGLGGSLVRSMALVEQASPQLQKDRVLSMLKVLRDDLRQVIDVGSSREVRVPDTPALWLAPLRHRFTLILDELGLKATWHVDPHWQHAPSALQCMAMSRFLEEAFANVLKHSRAQHIALWCTQPQACLWRVVLQDDGVGFDVAAVQSAGMGVGMHSMQARLGRVGGRLHVSASSSGSRLVAEIDLAPESAPSAPTTENIAASASQSTSSD